MDVHGLLLAALLAFTPTPPPTETVTCMGDGTSGRRYTAFYAYETGSENRYDEVVAQLADVIVETDRLIRATAIEGGGLLALRWTHTADCRPVIIPIEVDHTNSIIEIRRSGLLAEGNNAVIFGDVYDLGCGRSPVRQDDRPGPENRNNDGGGWAWVGSACWHPQHLMHEIAHSLGAVQHGAPNSNGGGHCTDDHDRLCYQETGDEPVDVVCGDEYEMHWDCNHDDYFDPTPEPGEWLDTHWNIANSVFLAPPPDGSGWDPRPGWRR